MSDLLGARSKFTDAASLPRWSSTVPAEEFPQLDPQSLPSAHVISPFPVRGDLNDKVILW